jgi:hypothetical protein
MTYTDNSLVQWTMWTTGGLVHSPVHRNLALQCGWSTWSTENRTCRRKWATR